MIMIINPWLSDAHALYTCLLGPLQGIYDCFGAVLDDGIVDVNIDLPTIIAFQAAKTLTFTTAFLLFYPPISIEVASIRLA